MTMKITQPLAQPQFLSDLDAADRPPGIKAAPFITPMQITAVKEVDTSGKHANPPGAKLDAGKIRPSLVLGGFARALIEVCKVGTYGAVKYTDNGWVEVPNGVDRYDDAKLRHWLKEKSGDPCDPDTDLMHAAHEAWNALARLDLLVRQSESK
jgi:hypothetical protein